MGFTQTNTILNETVREKDALLVELKQLSVHLNAMTVQLNQHKFAVNVYQSNEQKLLTQAKTTRHTLEHTISHRNVLFDKINKQTKIEMDNENKWNEKKNKLIEMNELFTQTNTILNETVREKDALLVELKQLSVHLNAMTVQLNQHKF